MRTTLLIPTLNEIQGMKQIMPRINKEWCDQIIFVDGGSTDGTIEYAKEQGYQVVIQNKPGLINAYRQVFEYIIGDMVITFSPDGNSVPELIPQLIAKMKEGFDMVIASRYLPGVRSEDDTWMTAKGNWVFTKLINILFGGHYSDAMVIYRAYRTSLVKELGLLTDTKFSIERNFCHIISWEPLLSIRAAKGKLKISEIPGDEPDRVGGKGKCKHISWGLIYLGQMIQEFVFWKFSPSL